MPRVEDTLGRYAFCFGFIVIGITIVLVLSASVAVAGPAGMDGDGTEDSPFEITNETQLQAMEDNLSANYTLETDLTLTSEFDPVGNSSDEFAGSFDGQDHEIANLTINKPSDSDVALFSYVSDEGLVANITLSNVTVTGNDYVAGAIGQNSGNVRNVTVNGTITSSGEAGTIAAYSEGTITDVTASGHVNSTGGFVGGVVGYDIGGSITNAISTATVESTGNFIGGAIGWTLSTTVENVSTSGTAISDESSSSRVGGLVGEHDSGSITNSTASGNVTGNDEVGGLVGTNRGDVHLSHATGTVTGDVEVGGLIGLNHDETNVTDSSGSGSVSGTNLVGGVIGFAHDGGTITNLSASGAVNGSEHVGGAIGESFTNASYLKATGTVNGSTYVGGLLGRTNGHISYSKATGTVTGSERVGGLIGDANDTVSVSYAVGNVTGSTAVGGLIGLSNETVEQTYAVGNVSGSTDVGGLLGVNDPGGTVVDSYRDVNTTTVSPTVGDGDDSGITNRTTAEMTGERPFETMSEFSLYDDWILSAEYPELLWAADVSGNGSESDPFIPSDPYQLQSVAGNLTASYTLAGAVDLTGSDDWFEGDGFWPIGDGSSGDRGQEPFEGNFDGDGNEIITLTSNRSTENYVGLFGYLDTGSSVSNLTITDGTILGDDNVGGLAGWNTGSVHNVSISSTVNGTDIVGGILGNNGGIIQNSTVDGTVNGSSTIGGAMGENTNDVSDISAAATVTGSGSVGGLIGESTGDQVDSIASGAVDGENTVGGAIGYLMFDASNLSATGDVNGSSNVGGLIGQADGDVEQSSASGDVSGTDRIGGLVGNGEFAGSFNNSSAFGSVEGSSEVGGLVGLMGNTVTKSYATGAVDGNDSVGGLIGKSTDSISIAYATGAVNGSSDVGGLVGINEGSIDETYAAGSVAGVTNDGGLIGDNSSADGVVDSYWDTIESGLSDAVGNGTHGSITGLTTDEMTGSASQDNMSSFFNSSWLATDDYPKIDWQFESFDSFDLVSDPIEVDETTTAIVELTFDDGQTTGTEIAAYDTNDSSIVTIDATGTVTAHNPGTASINATYEINSTTERTTTVSVVDPSTPGGPPQPTDSSGWGITDRTTAFVIETPTLSPSELLPGEETTVEAIIVNRGNRSGWYSIPLVVDDTSVDTREGWLEPNDSDTITFTYTETNVGTYQLLIGNHNVGTLVVTEEDGTDGTPVGDEDDDADEVDDEVTLETTVVDGEPADDEGLLSSGELLAGALLFLLLVGALVAIVKRAGGLSRV